MARPVLQRPKHGQGVNGCLCLAFIEQFGPVSKAEVVDSLRRYMTPATIRTRVARLVSSDLVLKAEGDYYVPRNLRQRLRADELTFGAAARAREVDKAIGVKQYAHQVNLLGGPTLSRVKSMLKKMPCFYCRTEPPSEGGEVEHFPPVRWGGSDGLSLLLPICRPCNGSHGGILKGTPRSKTPAESIDRIVFPGSPEEARTWLLQVFMLRAASYAAHLNDGALDEARQAALGLFPMWIALKSGVQIVDSTTGTSAELSVGHDMDVVAEVGEGFGGIPELLGGIKKKRRSR
jgi:hypothetical protein